MVLKFTVTNLIEKRNEPIQLQSKRFFLFQVVWTLKDEK
jgi:hypothetical protein